MARLRSAWPECRFSWLVNTEWAPLLAGNPDVDELILFPRQTFRGVTGPVNFLRWCRAVISGRKPALALDFQGLLRSALIGKLSRPRVFYGMADAREGAHWFYDRVAPVPTGVAHALDRYLMFAETVLHAADGCTIPVAVPRRSFPLTQGDALGVDADRLHRSFILLHPFARGPGKSLTVAQVEAFCRTLAPRQVVLVGRRGEAQLNVPNTVVDLLDSTSLAQLIWVMRRAACVISVDSGPAHLAAALGKPLIAIHTWSDPRRVGPAREDAWVWKNARLLPMSQMRLQEEAFFLQEPSPLSATDVDALCTLAISLSDSCA